MFDGPQISELIKDSIFDETLREAELFAWQLLKSVGINFLGNHRSTEYEKIYWRVSVKLHFLQSHLDYFSKNYEDLCEDHFYEDICILEERYQDWLDVNFLADYCWCLKRDWLVAEHRMISLKSRFIHE